MTEVPPTSTEAEITPIPPPQKPLFDVVSAELDREVGSGVALGARATALVAFIGLLLTLVGSRIGAIFDPCFSNAVQVALMLGVFTATGVLVGATWHVLGVLVPRERGRTRPQVFRDLRLKNPSERDLHDRLVQSLIRRYEDEATANDSRGEVLRRGYKWTLAGLVIVMIQALMLGVAQGEASCSMTLKTTTPTAPMTEALRP